ncbi:MAG: polysaccharide biosynthesis tyrosine autokinase [Acidobacteria bacterium]|nr:polysaccharide biosynthesis tyrosine autokinase [Acidobacteriota bacterium]
MASASRQQEFNLRDYWQILVRRRWLIFTCVLVTTIAAAVSSFLATPVYRSTATIAIERTGVRILRQDLSSSEPSWLDYQNFYNTQYRIIGADAVLRLAIKSLDLHNRNLLKDSNTLSLAEIKARLFKSISRSQVPAHEEDADYPYLQLLRGGLSVDPVRDSHLVEISYVSDDRRFAAEVANAIAEAYQTFMFQSKLDLARTSQEWFIGQLKDLQEDISKKENGLQEYARSKGIVTGEAGTEASMQNYADLRNRYTAAQGDAAEARAKWNTYRNSSPESLDEVRNNQVVQTLAQEAARFDTEYQQLLAKYRAEYPSVLQKKSQLDAAREKLREQTEAIAKRVIDAAEVDYQNKRRREQEFATLYQQAEQRLEQFKSANVEYVSRRDELDQLRKSYNELIDKRNSMGLAANLTESGQNVRTIDKAQPAHNIFKPKKKLNIMLGFLFGLFVGIGAAVLVEYIDNTIKTPDDVRNTVALPVLAMIPAHGSDTRKVRDKRRAAEAADKPPQEVDPALITQQLPLSPTAEAYRELRTAVLLATAGHPPRDLAVTSCQPGEGKTTTAFNLATALAQLGRRVLLVDTDLRRPRCHQVARMSGSRGVSTYLTGLSDLEGLVQPSPIERVSLIVAGPIPPNPAELLDSQRFAEMVRELRAHTEFDHVIFDSPPVLSVVDPLLIGRHVEGTVLVIKSAFTSRDAGRLAHEKLSGGRVNLLGVVLNAVHTEHVPYQYRYYRDGYIYGEGGKGEDGKRGRSVAAAKS